MSRSLLARLRPATNDSVSRRSPHACMVIIDHDEVEGKADGLIDNLFRSLVDLKVLSPSS